VRKKKTTPEADGFSEEKAAPIVLDEERERRRVLALLDLDGESKRAQRLATNVAIVLRCHRAWAGSLAYDELAATLVWLRPPPELADVRPIEPGPITETDHVVVQTWLARHFPTHRTGFFDRSTIELGMMHAARANSFHPIRDYLDGLVWDGTPRLDTLLIDHAGAEDSAYTRAVTAATFIAAAARVRKPGCKVDTMLILEGAQGIGKSSLLAHLAGLDWFDDHLPDLRDKDAPLHLRGRWLVEIAELDAMRSAETTRIKAFLSRQVDRFRPPYARCEVEVPRSCIFVGTTNATDYLSDGTGGRRFWPVAVRSTIHPSAIDRDQVWAEADIRFRAGEAWHLPDDLGDTTAEHQAARFIGDPWEDALRRELAGQARVTVPECLGLLQIAPKDQRHVDSRRIAAVLRRLGFERRRSPMPDETGRRVWGYARG
jgi:predicted P-loop ATPase